MKPTELAWAAGLFEGEGCVTIAVRNRDDTYRLIATISNTDEEVIDFFHARWDGWKQPLYGERPGRKPGWTWTVAGPAAETFLNDVLPYIRTERVRAKIALGLEFRGTNSLSKRERAALGGKARQRELYERMKKLNRRGV